MANCSNCHGTGRYYPFPNDTSCTGTCPECGGTGKAEKPRCSGCGEEMSYNGITGWECPARVRGFYCEGANQ